MPLGIEPTVDYAFKRLFGVPDNSDLLIDLLNAVLNFSDPIEEVEILTPLDEKEFQEDKLWVLDVKAFTRARAMFNVEMQTQVSKALRPRITFYNAGLYVGQLRGGEGYQLLMPAISICFLKEILFREVADGHLQFTMRDAKYGFQFTGHLQIHTIELPKYNFDVNRLPEAGRLIQWLFFLCRAAEYESAELARLLPDPQFLKAIESVEMMAQTPKERMLYEARRKAQLDFESFVAEARAEGLQQGVEQGIEQGRLEARRSELIQQIELLQSVLKQSVTDCEQLMSTELDELIQLRDRLANRLQSQ